ncbi:MAG: aminotransferase class I/II-fold pyridoxal phosphate-dependent enzyme [Desulfosalsimonadaceae bacterium]
MNPIAEQLNETIRQANPHLQEMLSEVGENLFFPKGILSQSAEAREKADKLNATIGIAREKGRPMGLPSVMSQLEGLQPEESLTYAPSFGLPELRSLWKSALFEKNPSLEGKSISLPVTANGITHAISVFADVWLDPADAVILPDMMWGNYNMILSVRKKARILHYPIFNEDGGYNTRAFADAVREAAQSRDKIVVLLNFPHNPTGYTLTEAEAEEIAAVLKETAEAGTNVIAVSDDAYFGLFYEEEALKESVFARLCGVHPRLLAVKLDGATKENYVWGLRVGFITYGCFCDGDPSALHDALERKTAGCVRGNISNASHVSQSIVLKSMQSISYQREKARKFEILRGRAEKLREVVADPKYADAWSVYPFNSGYFMCVRLKSLDAEKLRLHLLEHYGVGVIALGSSDIRIAFSCLEEQEIPLLFDTMLQAVRDLTC